MLVSNALAKVKQACAYDAVRVAFVLGDAEAGFRAINTEYSSGELFPVWVKHATDDTIWAVGVGWWALDGTDDVLYLTTQWTNASYTGALSDAGFIGSDACIASVGPPPAGVFCGWLGEASQSVPTGAGGTAITWDTEHAPFGGPGVGATAWVGAYRLSAMSAVSGSAGDATTFTMYVSNGTEEVATTVAVDQVAVMTMPVVRAEGRGAASVSIEHNGSGSVSFTVTASAEYFLGKQS